MQQQHHNSTTLAGAGAGLHQTNRNIHTYTHKRTLAMAVVHAQHQLLEEPARLALGETPPRHHILHGERQAGRERTAPLVRALCCVRLAVLQVLLLLLQTAKLQDALIASKLDAPHRSATSTAAVQESASFCFPSQHHSMSRCLVRCLLPRAPAPAGTAGWGRATTMPLAMRPGIPATPLAPSLYLVRSLRAQTGEQAGLPT